MKTLLRMTPYTSHAHETMKPIRMSGNGRPWVDLFLITCFSSTIGAAMRTYKRPVTIRPNLCSTFSGSSYWNWESFEFEFIHWSWIYHCVWDDSSRESASAPDFTPNRQFITDRCVVIKHRHVYLKITEFNLDIILYHYDNLQRLMRNR